MIETWHVRDALRSRLGSALTEETDIADRCAEALRSWASYKESFGELAARLEDLLFNGLYDALGPSMSARMDSGELRRIRTAELKDAADDVLGVLFDSLRVYSVHYDALREYAITSGSCAAMRTLYTRYGSLLSAEDRAVLARILRDRLRPEVWQAVSRQAEEARKNSDG